MHRHWRTIFLHLSSHLLTSVAWSEAARGQAPVSTAASQYRSAYFLGRGNTGIAVADQEEAIFYNPAGLALGQGIYKKTVLASPQIEFSRATRDLVRQLTAEDADLIDAVRGNIGTPNHLGIQNFTGIIFRRVALGAIASSNTDILAYKSVEEGGLEAIRVSTDQTAGLTFSLAESFFSNQLLLGITGKYLIHGKGFASASVAEIDRVKEEVKDKKNFIGFGQGEGADLGVMYKGGSRTPWSLGLTINDVGDTSVRPSEETALDLKFKQTINAGFAIESGTKTSKLRLLVDYRDIQSRVETNPRKKIHTGAELVVAGAIGMTGGLNQGYPTGGFFVDMYLMRLDLGFYTEEIGSTAGSRPDTRYVMRLKAGF